MVDIKEVLRLHTMWLANEDGGVQANLRWADLRWANLSGANLRGADLRWANLSGANLSEAGLSEADLSGANLRGANLSWAGLRWANLRGADLRWADLSEADLSEADLSEADLSGAGLWSVRGNGEQIKSLQIGKYDVIYTTEVLQIGCQRKFIAEWLALDSIPGREDSDTEWLAFKPLIKQIIEQYPATPTGKENQNG